MTTARRQKKAEDTKRITISLAPETCEILEARAAAAGLSLSAVVSDIVKASTFKSGSPIVDFIAKHAPGLKDKAEEAWKGLSQEKVANSLAQELLTYSDEIKEVTDILEKQKSKLEALRDHADTPDDEKNRISMRILALSRDFDKARSPHLITEYEIRIAGPIVDAAEERLRQAGIDPRSRHDALPPM